VVDWQPVRCASSATRLRCPRVSFLRNDIIAQRKETFSLVASLRLQRRQTLMPPPNKLRDITCTRQDFSLASPGSRGHSLPELPWNRFDSEALPAPSSAPRLGYRLDSICGQRGQFLSATVSSAISNSPRSRMLVCTISPQVCVHPSVTGGPRRSEPPVVYISW
jgi:hypothetical protein